MSACPCGCPIIGEDGMRNIHICVVFPLHQYSFRGKGNRLRRLLVEAGADANEKDVGMGYTPLHFASISGNWKMAEILLEFDADISLSGHDGRNVLHVAAAADGSLTRGSLTMVKFLLANGAASILNSTDLKGMTALHLALTAEIALELIAAGADIHKCNEEGVSPLVFAAQDGRIEVARELLKAGADVNQADAEGGTALMRAHDVPCVRMLLDAGAIPNAADEVGFNAMHHAIIHERSAGVICCLFKAGWDPRSQNIYEETPAKMARDDGLENTAALLDRLAEEAELAARNSRSHGSASMLIKEQEADTGVRESIGKCDSVGGRKPVKPCAHCGAITHRICSGCRVTHYCSRDCQCAAFAQHKKECAVLSDERMEAKAQKAAARAELHKIASEEG